MTIESRITAALSAPSSPAPWPDTWTTTQCGKYVKDIEEAEISNHFAIKISVQQ